MTALTVCEILSKSSAVVVATGAAQNIPCCLVHRKCRCRHVPTFCPMAVVAVHALVLRMCQVCGSHLCRPGNTLLVSGLVADKAIAVGHAASALRWRMTLKTSIVCILSCRDRESHVFCRRFMTSRAICFCVVGMIEPDSSKAADAG